MAVKQIVANIAAEDVSLAKHFYDEVLELDLAMDLGLDTNLGVGSESH